MVEKRIDSVKKEIRSVLIASKNGLSLENFRKSYRNLLGVRLPAREFGYTSDIDFLYSLPDVVHIQVDRNGSYQLHGIVDEATEHIHKLVSKQRQPKANPNSKSKHYSNVSKSNQYPLPKDVQRCRPFVPAQLRSEIIEIVKKYPDGIGYSSLILAYQSFYKKKLNLEWLSQCPKESFDKLANAIPELNLKVTQNLLKIHYLNLPCFRTSNKDTSELYNRPENSKASAKSPSPTTSIQAKQDKEVFNVSGIPENIKQNFEKLLKQYPKGILDVHFPILYEKLTKVPLDLHDLGYSSLIELVDALPDVFFRTNASLCSKDWILLHKDFSRLAPQPSGYKSRHQVNNHLSSLKASPSYCMKGNIPSDIAPPNLTYVYEELPKESTNKFIPVFLSSVINPGLFWVQLQNEEAISNLERLEKEMKSFYDSQEIHKYRMADADILIGSSCIAFSSTDCYWYRALITSLPSIDYVNVSFVDYGSWQKIHRSNLYYLKYTFIQLPAHAYKSRLASIKPINRESTWDLKAQRRFLQLCNHLYIMAKVDSVHADTLSLFLCDTNGHEDIHINDTLVEEGFAEFCLSDHFNSSSPIMIEKNLENGTVLSSEMKADTKTSEASHTNGFHLSNGNEKPKFQPRRLFVQESVEQKSSKGRRYVKKVLLGDGYKVNIIVVAGEAYVSGGDLCSLFWSDEEADVLALRLKFKDVIIPTISISEEDFEELFFQCKRYFVKGFLHTEKENYVVLYPLKYVMKVLNTLGHPSLSVRETLCKEIQNFDPHDAFWNEFQELNEEENLHELVPKTGKPLNRLCLYDLLAMNEVNRFKRLKLIKDLKENRNTSSLSEIKKIELMQNNISKQMEEIKVICCQYAS